MLVNSQLYDILQTALAGPRSRICAHEAVDQGVPPAGLRCETRLITSSTTQHMKSAGMMHLDGTHPAEPGVFQIAPICVRRVLQNQIVGYWA